MELLGEIPLKKQKEPFQCAFVSTYSLYNLLAHHKCHKIKIFTDKVMACLFHSAIKEIISNFTVNLHYTMCMDLS